MSHELQQLTRRQREYVVTAAMPEVNGSAAETARRLGVTRQSAHEILTLPDVSKAVEKRTKGHLDKARGSLAKIECAERKLLSKLDETADRDDLTPVEIGGLLKVALDARKLLTDMGIESEAPDPTRFLKVMDRVKLAAMREGWDARDRGEERP